MSTGTPWNGNIRQPTPFPARQGWCTGSVAGAVLGRPVGSRRCHGRAVLLFGADNRRVLPALLSGASTEA